MSRRVGVAVTSRSIEQIAGEMMRLGKLPLSGMRVISSLSGEGNVLVVVLIVVGSVAVLFRIVVLIVDARGGAAVRVGELVARSRRLRSEIAGLRGVLGVARSVISIRLRLVLGGVVVKGVRRRLAIARRVVRHRVDRRARRFEG